MSKINAFKRSGDICPVCSSNSGKCKWMGYNLSQADKSLSTTKILCMDGTGGNGSPDYHYFNDTKCGSWGVYIPLADWNSYRGEQKEVSQAERDAWKLEQDCRKQALIEEENIRREVSLDANDRDIAARAILGQLGLNYVDRADLTKRGFTAEQIRTIGFKSIDKWQKLSTEVNNRFPGVNIRGNQLNVSFGGVLIPLYSTAGEILGFQARNRSKIASNRYIWLSSANEPGRRNGGIPRLKNNENPLTFVTPEYLGLERKITSIGFAEGTGAKPWLAAIRRGQSVIGAAGGQWLSSVEQLKEGLIDWKADEIDLYLDKEDFSKSNVLMRWLKLHDWLKGQGYSPRFLWGNADIDEIEDLDALIVVKRLVLQDALDGLMDGKVQIDIVPPSLSRQLYRKFKTFTADKESLFLKRYFEWNLPDSLNNEAIAIKSALGTGKTEFLKALAAWAKERGFELLFIGYRNNLLRQTTDRIPNLIHIMDEDRIMLASDYHKAVCHHSANLIDIDRMDNKIIIFDECVSVFNDMLSSKLTAGRNPDGRDSRDMRLRHIQNMIESCHAVVVLDAYVTDTEVGFLQKLRSFDSVHKIENQYQNVMKVQMINKKSLVERSIIEDALSKINVLVTATTQKQCENVEKALIRSGIDLGKILRIDSTTDRTDIVRQFFRDPAAVLKEYQYQVLIMSPTVESGVSIDLRGYFATQYHFHMGNLSVLSGLQFLGRYRDFSAPRVIFCKKQGRVDHNSSSLDKWVKQSFDASVMADIELAIRKVDASLVPDVMGVLNRHHQVPNVWMDLAFRYKAGLNEEMKYMRELFIEALARDGYDVTLDTDELEACEDTEKLMSQAEIERRVLKSRQIFNADDINRIEYEKICKNMSANESDRLQATKYRLTQQQLPGIMETSSYSADLIQAVKFNCPALISQLEAYFYLIHPDLAERDRLAMWLSVVSTESAWLPDRIERSHLASTNAGRDLGLHELIGVEFDLGVIERIAQTIIDVPAYQSALKVKIDPQNLPEPLKLFGQVTKKFGLKVRKISDGVFELLPEAEKTFALKGASKYDRMTPDLILKIKALSGYILSSKSVKMEQLGKELADEGVTDGRGFSNAVIGAARYLGLITKSIRKRTYVDGIKVVSRAHAFDDPSFTLADTKISQAIANTQFYPDALDILGQDIYLCISSRLMALSERQAATIAEWQAARIRLHAELYAPIQIDAFADISKINSPQGRSGSEMFGLENIKSVAQTLYCLAKMPLEELKSCWKDYRSVMNKDVMSSALDLLRDKYSSLFDRLKLAF